MEKRAARVSEAQWDILLGFLEGHPNLARARGYNNSARGRAESMRLWQEVATLLNAEGSGTTKSPKEWSIYVSNYKSKLKKVVADINTDATATGGGPPQTPTLSDVDRRFLALLGSGFGHTIAPQVRVQPFPEQSTSATEPVSQILMDIVEIGGVAQFEEEVVGAAPIAEEPIEVAQVEVTPAEPTSPRPAEIEPLLSRRSRQRRQHTRPLAPLDEARRILSQVEMQRAAADAATARAHETMAHNLQPLADVARNLGRLANVAERYLEYIISLRATP